VRVLLTGAFGQLGWALQRGLAPIAEVVPLSSAQCDITDGAVVAAALREIAPQVVVNAAAYTSVDRAESEPERAHAVNGSGPGILAAAAARAGAELVHYSTDYVFDGTLRRPYLETDATDPVSVYGASKLAGERAVLASPARAWILRTAWLFGWEGSNFPKTILRLAQEVRAGERPALRVVDDQVGAPTYAEDLAAATAGLLLAHEQTEPGLYHVSGAGQASWYEVARVVLESVEVNGVAVEPISTSEYPTPARRPAYAVLDNGKWTAAGRPHLRDWRAAVAEWALARRGDPARA
jgi:dTDP-4-dehydrorhamnose reductase